MTIREMHALSTDPLAFCRWLHQQINAPANWQDWPDPHLDSAMRVRRLDTHDVLRRLEAVLTAAKEQS